jgi:hypothetical protein
MGWRVTDLAEHEAHQQAADLAWLQPIVSISDPDYGRPWVLRRTTRQPGRHRLLDKDKLIGNHDGSIDVFVGPSPQTGSPRNGSHGPASTLWT